MAVVVVLLLAGSAAVWWAKREIDPRRLGDRGHVTAEVDQFCQVVHVDIDGLVLEGHYQRSSDGRTVPGWMGRSNIDANGAIRTPGGKETTGAVEGRLHLDRKSGEWAVKGTFTADDGTVIPVSGGIEGKVFFTLACTIG